MKWYQFLLVATFCCLSYKGAYGQKAKKDHLVFVDNKGVLRYTKNKAEASFFGVNYTAPFAYGYRSIKALHLDVKAEIDKDIYHMARLGIDAFRVHVWDVEMSDSAGNLLQNVHLDLFDYLLAGLKKRGIKTIITPIAFWGNGYPERDERTPGFSTKWGKGRANVNDSAIRAQENYVQQFLQHINPYTNTTYHNDPDVIALEINNEPSHSGPKAGVTAYINRMVSAIKSTGWTKPIFYNIAQNPFYADAVAASDVNGYSFQWYPSGLVANRQVEGNFLPHVDRYAVPFDTIPAFRDKALMVYEFDAADILQSNMYPAMARSFKTAGMQWATQFAYDPLATAYANTEYQTHYLNLAYTPAKAISLLIASKVFHRIPRLKSFGTYPADSTFDVFRVSYKGNLGEMNSEDEFYYSNNTSTVPKSSIALQHIAGVGSSPIVHYGGSGAYFLDKLEDGIWRLEVMPDAIHIRDPFERASPKKEVTRIEWNQHSMQIVLPDIGDGFLLQAINKGNGFNPMVTGKRFLIKPGTYLLTRAGKSAGKWDAKATTGFLQLDEFVAPVEKKQAVAVHYQPVAEAVAGRPLTLHLQAAGLDTSDRIFLQFVGAGRPGGRSIQFQYTTANTYAAEIAPAQLTPGLMNYRIMVQKGDEYFAYPGGIQGNPAAWDYYNTDSYQLVVLPEGAAVSLFNAATDRQVLTYFSARRGAENQLLPAQKPGCFVYRMAVADMAGQQVFGFQTFVGNKPAARAANNTDFKTIIVRGQTTHPEPARVKLILINKNGIPFSAAITLPTTLQEVEVPLSVFVQDSMLLLPRPYPGFQPLWFTPAGHHSLSPADVEALQVVVGPGLLQTNVSKPCSMEIESIWLKK